MKRREFIQQASTIGIALSTIPLSLVGNSNRSLLDGLVAYWPLNEDDNTFKIGENVFGSGKEPVWPDYVLVEVPDTDTWLEPNERGRELHILTEVRTPGYPEGYIFRRSEYVGRYQKDQIEFLKEKIIVDLKQDVIESKLIC